MANRFLSNIRINDAYTLPASDGNNGQVISTDGAGNLSFIDQASGGGEPLIYLDSFTGTGSQTSFTLSKVVDDEIKTFVYIDGVYQEKDTYEIVSSTLTFSTAPELNHSIEVVIFLSAGIANINQVLYFYGKASESISKGDGVMFAGVQGDHFLFAKATQAAIDANHEYFIGLAAQDLNTNDFGYVTEFGRIDGLNTDIYNEGDTLWFDSGGTVAGALTSTEPVPPLAKIQVAAVLRKHQQEGTLFVRPTWYHELGELHDVNVTSVTDKDMLVWNNASGYWENTKVLGDITTGNITTSGTIDGVDISDFKSSYDAHTHDDRYYTETEIDTFLTNSTNWDTAYSWGDHALAGYLTSFTETDPVFIASPAYGITSTNITNWDTAYSWGNHATQSYATETFVNTAVANLVDSAPTTLDTLNELAAALGDDPNFATTVTNSIATKLPLAGGTLTGNLNGTTATFTGALTADSATLQQLDLRGVNVAGTNINTVDRGLYYWGSTQPSTGSPGDNYMMTLTTRDSGQNIQLAWGGSGNGKLFVRRADSGTYYDWTEFWSDAHFTSTNISNWNTAYGWGNHASAGYLTSYTETDTLASVTGRGNTTSNAIVVTAIDSGNPSALGDNIRVSGYGILGNRSTFYVTNNGAIQIGNGSIHNQDPTALFQTSSIELLKTTNISSSLNVTGNINISDAGYREVKVDQTDSAAVRLGVSSGSNEAFIISDNSGAGHISGDSSFKIMGYDSSVLTEYAKFTSSSLNMSTDINMGGNKITNLYGIVLNNEELTDLTEDGQIAFDLNDSNAPATLGTYGGTQPEGLYLRGSGTNYQIYHTGHFSGTNISNWQTAYGWGNHASAGYAAASHTHTWANINGETSNSVNDWGGLRHQTNDGYIDFGPANSSWAHIYTDRPGFYFNKSLVVSGGSEVNVGDVRSPIFYDSNDTSTYINTSAGVIRLGQTSGRSAITHYDTGGYLTFRGTTNSSPENWGWSFTNQDSGSTNYTTYFRIDYTGQYTQSLGSSRAPIFYDSNNTGYYVDPASTSVLNAVNVNSITIGSGITLQESADRADLLEISSTTSGWGGLQIRNSANEGRWSFMVNGANAGIYDDENNDWHIYMTENAGVDIRHNGNTKLETTSSGVSVTGALTASGDVTAFSDARLKENVETIDSALDKVNQLRGVKYNKIGEDKNSIGVIAQEIEKVVPEVVLENEDGIKSVAYGNITAVLIEAVKELSNKVEELENKLNGTD